MAILTREEFKKLTKSEKNAVKKECFKVIKEKLVDKDGIAALQLLKPSLYGFGGFGGGNTGSAKYQTFANLFTSAGTKVDEMKLFQEMKIGRKEANSLVKEIIRKTEDPKQVKWIAFDPEKGIYTCVKIGDMPKDWTGYIKPVEIETPKIDDTLI